MEWWKQIESAGEVRRKEKAHFLIFIRVRWKERFEFFALTLWRESTRCRRLRCAIDKYLYFILYIFPISDSAKASLLENIPHVQIYKFCTVGHIYQSDYSDADWINRISMAAKSNTLIPCADTCQLHGARLNREANLSSKRFLNKILIYTILYLRGTILWCFWLPVFLTLGDFTCSPAHTPTHSATRA